MTRTIEKKTITLRIVIAILYFWDTAGITSMGPNSYTAVTFYM